MKYNLNDRYVKNIIRESIYNVLTEEEVDEFEDEEADSIYSNLLPNNGNKNQDLRRRVNGWVDKFNRNATNIGSAAGALAGGGSISGLVPFAGNVAGMVGNAAGSVAGHASSLINWIPQLLHLFGE